MPVTYIRPDGTSVIVEYWHGPGIFEEDEVEPPTQVEGHRYPVLGCTACLRSWEQIAGLYEMHRHD